ncbi:unnamed protein product [Caenorhabditis sp. 36 PRJEB53466]|nr:unnamed protein product [Caenorhabditis sp. 36 PRJEB53466]
MRGDDLEFESSQSEDGTEDANEGALLAAQSQSNSEQESQVATPMTIKQEPLDEPAQEPKTVSREMEQKWKQAVAHTRGHSCYFRKKYNFLFNPDAVDHTLPQKVKKMEHRRKSQAKYFLVQVQKMQVARGWIAYEK